jgi:hypothetical protein
MILVLFRSVPKQRSPDSDLNRIQPDDSYFYFWSSQFISVQRKDFKVELIFESAFMNVKRQIGIDGRDP